MSHLYISRKSSCNFAKENTIGFSRFCKFLLLLLSVVLCLAACAKRHAAILPLDSVDPVDPASTKSTVYDRSLDPDGDGDIKGIKYFPLNRAATGDPVFIFDPNVAAWALYGEDGKRLNTGRASGGRDYCPDVHRPCRTITGQFKVLSKGGADCESTIYPIETNGGAPMPYCMRFSPMGYAVHGSNDVPDHNACHGCVRVTPTAAEWLSNNYMDIGSTVVVLPYN